MQYRDSFCVWRFRGRVIVGRLAKEDIIPLRGGLGLV